MRIGIGTAQFGFDYGISNNQGQTSKPEVFDILDTANKLGVTMIDTSPAYGNAEQILGSYPKLKLFKCITKATPIQSTNINRVDASELKKGFFQSLKHLKLLKTDGLIIHNSKDIHKNGFEYVVDILHELKAHGHVNKIGASVYEPQDVDRLLSIFKIDLIQLPLNVFSQDFIKSGLLNELSNRNIEIHVRSIFLQGAVFINPDRLPEHLGPLKTKIAKLNETANDLGISAFELAIDFIKSQPQINTCIVGVNNREHFTNLVSAFNKRPKEFDASIFHLNCSTVTNPSNW